MTKIFDAIENAKNEIAANRRVAQHNLTANIDDIVPYDNSDYLDMVSLILRSLVGKT